MKSRILIVEDNKIVATVLINHCARTGFAVDHALSVKCATTYLLQRQYGLIFMDLGLEDGDGKALTRWIREEENPNQHATIIVISAHMDDPLKKACFEAGANEVLVKPVLRTVIDKRLQDLSWTNKSD